MSSTKSQFGEIERVAVIGAEVHGVDLTPPLSDRLFAEVRSALAAHGVLFFRDQTLSGEQLLQIAGTFGEFFIQPVFADKFRELLILENDAKRRPVLNTFHQDMTGLECPPGEHFLHALVVPDGGGDTIWSSNYAVYESLSDKMQNFLAGLTTTHSLMKAYGAAFDRMPDGAAKRIEIAAKFPPVHHPVVRTHPVTGRKGLFVNRIFTERIDDMKEFESRRLLDFLFERIEVPEFCVRLRWRVGTLAIWDNRCTSHYAVADYYPQHRKMQRASVCGERPV